MKIGMQTCVAGVVLFGAVAAPAVCLAEIYGWIDGSGVVTYSNIPPPSGTDVTQVIHEEPVSPRASAEAAQRAENEALKDRVRLLELEMFHSQRAAPDFPVAAAPAAPLDVGCGPYSYDECNNLYWYGGLWWPRPVYYRGREKGISRRYGQVRPLAPVHAAARSAVAGGGGAHAR